MSKLATRGVIKSPSIKMIRSLRNMGYNNYDAILDISDNAIDAKATKIVIDIEKGASNSVRNIYIADNGAGMDKTTLLEAIRLGSETEHSKNDLGKFGMGLSTASLSLTESTLVTSKKGNTRLMTVQQDLTVMEAGNNFYYPIHDAKPVQENKFNDMLENAENGTLVSLIDCDNIRHKYDTFVANLRERFARQFRVLIENGLEIIVNHQIVRPDDFLQLENPDTSLYFDDMVDVSYTNRKGKLTEGKIRIRIAKLGASAYNLSQSNQGFSIIRNGRELTFNQRLDMWTRHPQYNKLRGEIFFTDELDECMGVNVDKSKIDIHDEALAQIKDAIHSVVDKLIKDLRLEAEQRKREKEAVEGNIPTHDDSSKRIQEVEKRKVKEMEADAKEEKDLSPGGEAENETSEKQKTPAPPKVVEWEAGSHGMLSPIFQSYKRGKTIVVEYNQDHKFYDRFVVGTSHDKELQTEVDMLIYALASAKESMVGDEFTMDAIESFMQHVGVKLAKLLEKE